MAKILVYTELHGSHVKGVTLEILGKLTGHTLEVAAMGAIPSEAQAELAKFGASKVHALKGSNLDKYSKTYSLSFSKKELSTGFAQDSLFVMLLITLKTLTTFLAALLELTLPLSKSPKLNFTAYLLLV